jgi:hypothetical protein
MAIIGVYGQTQYGFSVYSESIFRKTATNFVATRGVEGPQIILTWDKPGEFAILDNLRIVRKLGSFPANETDGKNIFETSDFDIETFTDFPSFGPEFYYYKIFSQEGSTWFSTRLSEVVALAHDTKSEVQDKFFFELAEIHRVFDKQRFGSQQLALQAAQALTAQEKILLGEDGVTEQGELRRFLKLFNIYYNEIIALIRPIATRDGLGIWYDIFRTSPQNLFYIGKLYGWDFNFDLDVNAARKELIAVPETYSKKGREDQTEDLIQGLLDGHIVDIISADEVVDFNDYPDSSFLDTTDIIKNVNFLTAANDIYVFADINNDSSIGFNKVVINVITDNLRPIKASTVVKVQNLAEDFFNILDDVFLIIHMTFNVAYPTDFTTAGQAFIGSPTFPDPIQLSAFFEFAVGEGDAEWDYTTTPSPGAGAVNLLDEKYRDLPRNVVYLDGSDDPTITPTKKSLVRCFMDLETFTSLSSREVGLFNSVGTLLLIKYFPIRFINANVRFIIDFKITWP